MSCVAVSDMQVEIRFALKEESLLKLEALSENVIFRIMCLIVYGRLSSLSWKRVENVSLIKEMAGRAFLEKYDFK